MESKAILCFVGFWIGCTLQVDLSAQTIIAQPQYQFQHFTTNDGLPVDYVGSIAQDSIGFIWMRYHGGISRFDGYNFKVYRHDPNDTARSLPLGQPGNVLVDPDGGLWVTEWDPSKDYQLWKFDRNTDGFIHYRSNVNGATINGVYFERESPTIWLTSNGTGIFCFNTETRDTKNYYNDHSDSLTRAMTNAVFGMSIRDTHIILATRKGLWRFDKETKKFSRPAVATADSTLLFHNPVWDINDKNGSKISEMWLWMNRRFLMVDENLSVVKHFDFPEGFYPLVYDREETGVLWFSSSGNGLYRYNPKDDTFVNIRNIPADPNSLKTNSRNSVSIDRDQNIWVGSEHGLSKLQKERLHFYNYTLPARIDESSVYTKDGKDYLIINQSINDRQDILIAPINANRLDTLQFEKLTSVFQIPANARTEMVIHGLWKGSRNFWFGLFSRGVGGIPIPATAVLPEPKGFHLLSHDPENSNTISSNQITFVWEDSYENLWLGTRGVGLNKVNLNVRYGKNGSVTRYKHIENDPHTLSSDIVWNICQEDEKSFWIVTAKGIDLFRNERVVQTFKVSAPFVYKAHDSTVFFGAMDGLHSVTKQDGRYRVDPNKVLNIDHIVRIQDDELGRMWVSSPKGIFCYSRDQKILIGFNEKDGFNHLHAIQPWIRQYKTSQGLIVISDLTGISIFDPATLDINRARTLPVLTGLKVNNQDPVIGERAGDSDKFSIIKHISVLDLLILDYKHNNFSIEFSAMEMTSPDKNLYRHMLKGYDKEWIESDWKNRTAAYTNLDPGEYTFKVRASNHHGIWSDQETTLTIQILPPPWKTWWAYTLYGTAALGIFLSLRRYDINRVVLKHRAEHLSELDTLKTRFFANISHEFRTPITLILGPLKDLQSKANSEDQKTLFGTMLRNGQRLLRLVNQLLDLSRLEAGKMKLHASQTDLVQFLREIAASYESLAADRKIRFFFYPEKGELLAYIDPEKIEKVVHNLLSNAFKFTSDGGEVILNLKPSENHAVIIVKDTGIGIPANELDKVFDRFYQVDSSQTRGYEGSGLGMALAKELVELHHGIISVESRPGEGSTFTVRLPLGKEHLREEGILPAHPSGGDIGDFTRTKQDSRELQVLDNAAHRENGNEQATIPSDQPVLLIVEDNADMRNYIRRTLSDQYQIVEAENGKAGLEKAKESVPDLIISDIMMPEMDGYALCDKIKSNELTSHIPVILLTAKADRESKLQGLETGADDYLAKPFDADELKLIVRNRIEERRKMRERFSREVTLEPRQIAITSLDEKFLMKVLAIIEEHMDDEHFSIDELSREAGYSNMHFYRKIKALADQTPSQFLRTIRLKRAAELLSKNSDNVTQIAYSVGFSSLSYFNKCFKEQFGVTPGQYTNVS